MKNIKEIRGLFYTKHKKNIDYEQVIGGSDTYILFLNVFI